MLLTELLEFTIPGVYAIINEDKKKIHISYSTNVLASVSRILTSDDIETKDIRLDIESLNLIILSDVQNRNIQRFQVSYYIETYKSRGYSLYKEVSPLVYKVRSEIVRLDETIGGYKSVRVFVYLETKNRSRYVIGVFNNNEEALLFMEYYKSGVKSIIIANNKDTKDYYLDKSYDYRYKKM